MERAPREPRPDGAITFPSAHAGGASPRIDARAMMDLAREGDLSAWSTLYQQSYEAVYRQMCYLTGDAALAEDFTQESFARAFASMVEFDARGTFVAWVRGIGLNLVRMHWRRDRTTRRVHHELTQVCAIEEENPAREPDREQQRIQRMEMLYDVLATLPSRLREAFVLRELQGLDVQDAAAQLDISPGNLAVRVTRARDRIRRELQRRGWLGGA